jgi:hypothetical protein
MGYKAGTYVCLINARFHRVAPHKQSSMKVITASVTLLAVAVLSELCAALPTKRADSSTPTGESDVAYPIIGDLTPSRYQRFRF